MVTMLVLQWEIVHREGAPEVRQKKKVFRGCGKRRVTMSKGGGPLKVVQFLSPEVPTDQLAPHFVPRGHCGGLGIGTDHVLLK